MASRVAGPATAPEQDTSGARLLELPAGVWELVIGRLQAHHRAALRGVCQRFRSLVNSMVTKIKLDPTHSEDALQWRLHSRFSRLEHIEVIKPSEVDCFTDTTFAQLALKDLSRLSGLSSLNLEHCTQLSVAGVAALALACPGVSRLVIPQVCQLCMSDAMLLVLARLPELGRLRVMCCKHCNEVALAYLSDLRRLTALELEDYGQALRQVTQLTALTSLRSIMVWSDYNLDVADHINAAAGGAGGHPQGAHPHPPPHPLQGGHPGAGGPLHGPLQLGGGGGVVGAHAHHPPLLGGLGLGAGGAGGGAGGGGGLPELPPNPIAAAAEVAAMAVAQLNLLHGPGGGGGAGGGAGGGEAGGGGEGGAAGPGPGPGGPGGGLNADVAFVHQLQLTEQVLTNIFAGRAALLDWVTGLTQLTHVDIQRVDISGSELQRFAALPSLVHLGVGDLNLLEGGADSAVDPLRPLPSVTKLVSHNITAEAALRTTFPALRALSCDSADSGLAHIAELRGLVNLFLWTSPSDSITDAGLASLSGLRALETFRLEGSDTVSDGGWVRFAEAHSGLTRIDLVKCPGVTDIGFILSLRQLSRLARITFLECPGIDTRTLAALLAFCPALEHVELQDCPAVTLAALRSLLGSVPRPDLNVVYRKGGASRVLHGSG
ncbi:hypothetical protein HYH03_016329 [Edaphochlamys debaryana]|uniref:F-box domain-containing protein n=1 Tax=Edaphochlamys debaryana TaxID=47281 RepID=A0A835XLE7_9CHLO|nr:hypothetical protein HYH03_016329 [Edaphochlamys debaryana]|eukprot:KAG2484943.1 hypothetical protein HYH03_016329 [Edaphochlamys debaryana]